MAETGGAPPPRRRVPPMITLPQRSSAETFLTVNGVSPGPMTFVSNFFSDHYPDADLQSFSQILAGIVPFPAVQTPPRTPVSQPENRLFLLGAVKEESQTTQILDPDYSRIESYSVSESCNSNPGPVVMSGSTFFVAKAASDGYNWRKYGQKQVKSSELPRSYYRCSQTNCPVTKKIGHFLDGQINEIIYNGQHNHEPPRVCKRANDGVVVDRSVDSDEQVSGLMANGVAGDDCDLKRRKTKVETEDSSWSSRVMVSQPKIVVQTRSEVDILDDGFKWRKYGQKVVKGNTYPRSYYRCTNVGCKVRKHVERDLADPKSVVTTYEGRHKHDIPVVAKTSKTKAQLYYS